ncbi:MAG: flagellar basal-body rod protein FlgG [Bdellovibrionales bacterium]|nr:flagellar basal-body rod protein FlgG [Bdellovibrionales bacterium]
MLKSLNTAATSLNAQQANIERISNDLANANTDGYKRGSLEFEDLMYTTLKEPGAALGDASQSPVGVQVGTGVKVGAVHKIFEQGPARMTYHPYDLMIQGNGFFQVQQPNGQIGYTRNGAFHLDAQGRLTLSNGAMLLPQVTVPPNTTNVMINGNGEIQALMQDGNLTVIGQVQLHTFQNEQGLRSEGAGIYQVSQASGEAIPGIPNENGFGIIQQGALESSNTNVANSMVEMITTQRAYEMGTKVMGVADKMLESTVNLR